MLTLSPDTTQGSRALLPSDTWMLLGAVVILRSAGQKYILIKLKQQNSAFLCFVFFFLIKTRNYFAAQTNTPTPPSAAQMVKLQQQVERNT